jgi:hypothetical protein
MNNCSEKAAHKGLDYGKDQLEPPDTHSRVVRIVDRSGAFSLFRMSRRDIRCCGAEPHFEADSARKKSLNNPIDRKIIRFPNQACK